MALKLGIVMDPLIKIHAYKDSTLAMLREASRRDYEIFYFEQQDLFLMNEKAWGRAKYLKVNEDYSWNLNEEPILTDLGFLDVLLMRIDPPFNLNYIYTTYILEHAEKEGVLVINKPQSLRDANEKLFATHFLQCIPPTLVSSSSEQIKCFAKEHEAIVLKPLDGMGGKGVFRTSIEDSNLSVIIEMLTQNGNQPIMVQEFLPAIEKGDKRIILIDGEAIPQALVRIPQQGEHRANLAAGGRGEAQPLNERDYWLCKHIGPVLKEKGLVFVGIDVIGDYITEINVTSPTGIRELDRQCGLNISGILFDCIENTLVATVDVSTHK